MAKEPLMQFLGTGMLVLPAIMAVGTGSLDAVAMTLFPLLMLMLALLTVDADDPIGDKLESEARDEDDPPQ